MVLTTHSTSCVSVDFTRYSIRLHYLAHNGFSMLQPIMLRRVYWLSSKAQERSLGKNGIYLLKFIEKSEILSIKVF